MQIREERSLSASPVGPTGPCPQPLRGLILNLIALRLLHPASWHGTKNQLVLRNASALRINSSVDASRFEPAPLCISLATFLPNSTPHWSKALMSSRILSA